MLTMRRKQQHKERVTEKVQIRRRAAETEDQRRLARLSVNRSERLAAETEEQRAARLARLNANRSERLATETKEQRAARFATLSANQSERLAIPFCIRAHSGSPQTMPCMSLVL